MRLAVIDCGTNTFHLLIVDKKPDQSFAQVYKERQYVRLGQEGLDCIGQVPFQRGLACIAQFSHKMQELGVTNYRAFGTEALRRACNGRDFIDTVMETTGVEIQMISGEEEARLIHLGTMKAVPAFGGKTLIMDIGGGSVEFIIASEEEVFWAKSFPVGVQVLFSRFHKNDPITDAEVNAIQQHLDVVLAPFIQALRQHETPLLTGASGSFEVVEDMLVRQKTNPLYSTISTAEFYKVHEKVIQANYQSRLLMPGLPKERAELIVVGIVLIDYVVKRAGIRQFVTSAYALKEGMLMDMDLQLAQPAAVRSSIPTAFSVP